MINWSRERAKLGSELYKVLVAALLEYGPYMQEDKLEFYQELVSRICPQDACAELIVLNAYRTQFAFTGEGKIYLPTLVYDPIYQKLPKQSDENLNNKINLELEQQLGKNMIITKKTPFSILQGLLPHETLHLLGCRSFGRALGEGIAELKAREYAIKHQLPIIPSYSKEAEIALCWQKLLGRNLINALAFMPKQDDYLQLLSPLVAMYFKQTLAIMDKQNSYSAKPSDLFPEDVSDFRLYFEQVSAIIRHMKTDYSATKKIIEEASKATKKLVIF